MEGKSGITDSKHALEVLRQSEKRYRLLADNTDDFVSVESVQGKHIYISPSYFRVTGWTPELLRSSNWRARMHPGDLARIQRAKKASRAGQTTIFEHRIRCRDGRWIWVEQHCKPICSEDGKVKQLLLWARDITRRKGVEESLEAATVNLAKRVDERTQELSDSVRQLARKNEQVERLATRLMNAHEEERRRIASGLHDEVGQLLAAIRLKLGALRGVATQTAGRRLISETDHLVMCAVRAIRELTFDLSSPTLYELGLEQAIDELCKHMTRKFGLSFEFRGKLRGAPIPLKLRSMLYHAIRELLLNVVKHAKAKGAKVHMLRREDLIRVTVTDDGKGFNVSGKESSLNRAGGFGLYCIRERLEDVHGHLSIRSKAKGGTLVEIEVPFS